MNLTTENNDRLRLVILLVLGAFGYFMIIPYQLALLGASEITVDSLLIGASINLIILAIMIFIGLRLAKPIELGTPLIDGLLNRESISERLKNSLKFAPLLGVISGLTIILLDLFVFAPLIPASGTEGVVPPLWTRVLAIFYGGIYEELFLRLFIMTIIVWLFWKATSSNNGNAPNWIYWVGIIISSVIFGVLHLPTTAAIIELTPMIILRAIILNGIPGTIFGWLYWKHGIESAMIGHLFADLTIHVILMEILLALAI